MLSWQDRASSAIATESSALLLLITARWISVLPLAAAAGFVKPSPVQAAAIPLGLVGCDLIVQAKSGTGKTVCFGTISLLRVHPGVAQPQVVVVTPTREIASQVADVIRSIATGYPNVRVGCFIGGQVRPAPAAEHHALRRSVPNGWPHPSAAVLGGG